MNTLTETGTQSQTLVDFNQIDTSAAAPTIQAGVNWYTGIAFGIGLVIPLLVFFVRKGKSAIKGK